MNYIKTNNKWARQRGTTLIELSVVIAVILLLAGVLFIGVTAWRDSANKAACIVNLSSIQKASRGYQNAHLLNVGDPFDKADLQTDKYFGATLPTCPVATNTYNWVTTIPDVDTPFAKCIAAHTPVNGFVNW
jgi:prepilin-type N-terminal cleavage/methylation domain-containing protein